jgi:hypothetical protein
MKLSNGQESSKCEHCGIEAGYPHQMYNRQNRAREHDFMGDLEVTPRDAEAHTEEQFQTLYRMCREWEKLNAELQRELDQLRATPRPQE